MESVTTAHARRSDKEFMHYERSADGMMMHASNELTYLQSKGTEKATIKAVLHFLACAAKPIKMQAQVGSYAACLVVSQDRGVLVVFTVWALLVAQRQGSQAPILSHLGCCSL